MASGLIFSKDGVEKRPLIQHESGVLIRQGWGPDLGVMKEWAPVYRRLESRLAGHVVMDVGANIGMFSTRALAMGAVMAFAFEPEPGAFSVLQSNLAGKPASLFNVAVGAEAGVVMLSTAPSGNATSATTMVHLKSRQHHKVPQVAFDEIVEQYQPSLLKVDCEGSELEFLDGCRLPSCVRVVTAELHRENGWEPQCQKVIASFADWNPIKPPQSYSFHRCWLINYER